VKPNGGGTLKNTEGGRGKEKEGECGKGLARGFFFSGGGDRNAGKLSGGGQTSHSVETGQGVAKKKQSAANSRCCGGRHPPTQSAPSE